MTFWPDFANAVLAAVGTGRLVAIDGVDGSGKTHFAANLAAHVTGRPVAVVHVDDFLNPPRIRHAKGRHSPFGFWEDTYDYRALESGVQNRLEEDPAVLVLVEGMFLLRDDLASRWDASIHLAVPFTVTAARMAVRDGSHPDPEHPSMRRYVGGQRLYFEAARPWERADFVIDNSDYAHPRVVPAPGR
ncbi:uridine kinase [Microbacterium sp. KUDC0406]|uniref:uridine kinase n=1 Tax=Microbacterium sp. KUDC0406 TaxID=2909588 RepID=UPI001F31C845|nr:uridine kinase [Microbacterium sp. KUDC0406]UJP10539.1 uridine kinase [Microbacterium sp. KUDC0406]